MHPLRLPQKARGDVHAHQRINGYKAEAGHLGEVAIEFIDAYIPNPELIQTQEVHPS